MTDFSTWDRATLEKFARVVTNDNARLKEDLKTALAAWRNELQKAKP